jgi:predicted RNA-binding Zn-ribbon protein involved in translation (DUF1610 family)
MSVQKVKCKNCGFESNDILEDFTSFNKYNEVILKCPRCGKNPC